MPPRGIFLDIRGINNYFFRIFFDIFYKLQITLFIFLICLLPFLPQKLKRIFSDWVRQYATATMPFAHIKIEDDAVAEAYDEDGVTPLTAERNWGKLNGIRFNCSTCGKKNVEHYLRLGFACKQYKTLENRIKYAQQNSGSYCYLKGTSKTCEHCLEVRRKNQKLYGKKTKKQLAEEKQILIDIIKKNMPEYKPQSKTEADALGMKFSEPK